MPAPGGFYDPKDYQPDESVAYLMRRILDAVAAEAERELVSSGLTNAQWVPLFKLTWALLRRWPNSPVSAAWTPGR